MLFKTLLFSLVLLSCNNTATNSNTITSVSPPTHTNPYPDVKSIPLPAGFERLQTDSSSFSFWLRSINLKEDKTVHLYNGDEKRNQQAQYAVMNISVGNKDLQQCADAIMRLRAEYLLEQNRFEEIIFYDNDKTAYKFTEPYTRNHFDDYLQLVFRKCGSASLSTQLKSVNNLQDIQPGDVFIRGGFPGHAVIVTDVAVNKEGKKIFMLAQSYMPAQEIHILKSPFNAELLPWYDVTENENIITPEYVFKKNELKRW